LTKIDATTLPKFRTGKKLKEKVAKKGEKI